MVFRNQQMHTLLINRIKASHDQKERQELSEILRYMNRLEAALVCSREHIYELRQDLRRKGEFE